MATTCSSCSRADARSGWAKIVRTSGWACVGTPAIRFRLMFTGTAASWLPPAPLPPSPTESAQAYQFAAPIPFAAGLDLHHAHTAIGDTNGRRHGMCLHYLYSKGHTHQIGQWVMELRLGQGYQVRANLLAYHLDLQGHRQVGSPRLRAEGNDVGPFLDQREQLSHLPFVNVTQVTCGSWRRRYTSPPLPTPCGDRARSAVVGEFGTSKQQGLTHGHFPVARL